MSDIFSKNIVFQIKNMIWNYDKSKDPSLPIFSSSAGMKLASSWYADKNGLRKSKASIL